MRIRLCIPLLLAIGFLHLYCNRGGKLFKSLIFGIRVKLVIFAITSSPNFSLIFLQIVDFVNFIYSQTIL